MAVNVPNFDAKVRVIIGDLLMKADPESKLVISAFDPSKDTSVNSSVLGGSKFSVSQLDACAKFFSIETSIGEKRIFPNKPTLAKRIILEIWSLFPTACADCTEEYAIKFNSDNPPALRCYLCFQGSHDCDKFRKFAADTSSTAAPVPSGSVWLCNECHILKDPLRPKKINQIVPSKPGSNNTSGQNSPVISKSSHLNTEELSKKLLEHQHRQAQQQQQQQHRLEDSPVLDVCEKFKVGKCPHGVSGKTLYNGQACNKTHPKRCSKFMKNGSKGRYGCKKGDSCNRYHPSHCKSSLANKCCYKKDCTLVHLVGTKRKKRSAEHVNRDEFRQGRSSESASRSYRRPKSDGDQGRPPTQNKESSPFLEVPTLLKLMQKDLLELKSNMASQETRISAMLPNIR